MESKGFRAAVWTRDQWLRGLALFFIGIWLGSMVTSLLAAGRVHLTIRENSRLKQEITQLGQRVTGLEESLAKEGRRVVRQVRVEIDHSDERVVEMALQVAQEPLATLVGQEVETLDPLVVRQLIHGRTMQVGSSLYQINLVGVHVDTEMLFFLSPQLLRR